MSTTAFEEGENEGMWFTFFYYKTLKRTKWKKWPYPQMRTWRLDESNLCTKTLLHNGFTVKKKFMILIQSLKPSQNENAENSQYW